MCGVTPALPMRSRCRRQIPDQQPAMLRPAEPAEFEQALAHALQFDGRKAFRRADTMMAAIAAAHVAQCLERAGILVMKKPSAAMHSAPLQSSA
jgi:hypothetical protein